MKRLALALATIAVISCSKEMQTASVKFSLIESGEMTKSIQEDISSLVTTTPIKLTIQSQTKAIRSFECKVGETITLPCDTYDVLGNYSATTIGRTANQRFTADPSFSISQTIVVNENKNIQIKPKYECAAILMDKTDTKAMSFVNQSYGESTIDFWCEFENYNLVFIQGDFTLPLTMYAYPKDEDKFREKQSFNLANKIEKGKYYILHPNEVETAEGCFGYDLPEMIEGNL